MYSYGSEMCIWNDAEQSKICAVKMSYLRAASGLILMDEMKIKEVNERYGMGEKTVGVNCRIVEWVRQDVMNMWGRCWRRDWQNSVSE